MPKPKHALVTGATGFVGSHLAYRLLEDGAHVTALARGSKTSSARDRVLDVLARISPSNGWSGNLARLQVLDGDITQPNLGVATDAILSVIATADETWH